MFSSRKHGEENTCCVNDGTVSPKGKTIDKLTDKLVILSIVEQVDVYLETEK